MNINLFFIFIFISLISIFVFFKPMKLQNGESVDVASVEVYRFNTHELSTSGLNRIIQGSKALIYQDIYIIKDVNYTDSTKDMLSNLTSNNGIYKNNVIDLDGNVVYKRSDGLTLKSNKLSYNEKTSVLKTDENYVMYRGKNEIKGKSFSLNNELDRFNSKNVQIVYDTEGNI